MTHLLVLLLILTVTLQFSGKSNVCWLCWGHTTEKKVFTSTSVTPCINTYNCPDMWHQDNSLFGVQELLWWRVILWWTWWVDTAPDTTWHHLGVATGHWWHLRQWHRHYLWDIHIWHIWNNIKIWLYLSSFILQYFNFTFNNHNLCFHQFFKCYFSLDWDFLKEEM